MLVLVFMTDKETLAEQVYSELALERRKENIMQLIQNNNILQNIYIYYILYKIYNIRIYTCGRLKLILLLNDQHLLPS